MANILVAASPAPGHFNPMLSVAKHLSSIGHSITFLSGSLFRDQAVALGFRFVPLSGKAGFNYMRLNEEFPERAAAKPGPEALNAECIYTDPARDSPVAVRRWLDLFDPRFIGLTGTERAIEAVEQAAGVPPATKTGPAKGDYGVTHASYVLAYTKDNLAHVIYPGGVSKDDWVHDLPLLIKETWMRPPE
jgi:hypothetical protein